MNQHTNAIKKQRKGHEIFLRFYREGRVAEIFLTQENILTTLELYWGNKVSNAVDATLQRTEPSTLF